MRYFTLIVALLCLPVVGQAEKGQSIMFGDQDPLYVERTRDTTADEQADHCTQLRKRMKELLGKRHRHLVEKAKYKRHTKKVFLKSLTDEQASAIRRIFSIEPGMFWRAARGRTYLSLPPRQEQTFFDFMADEEDERPVVFMVPEC